MNKFNWRKKVLLVDFNQVVISNFMAQVGNHTNIPLDESLLRHMILNTIRLNRNKFAGKYDEMVICCDSKKYWRRDVFPYYKASRKKDREASGVDWSTMFNTLSTVRQELIDNFPYKTLMVEGAEADDIIGTLVHKYNQYKKEILILSSDKDFMQLQIYPNVKQYSPVHKKYELSLISVVLLSLKSKNKSKSLVGPKWKKVSLK